jgi:hypothetical protein
MNQDARVNFLFTSRNIQLTNMQRREDSEVSSGRVRIFCTMSNAFDLHNNRIAEDGQALLVALLKEKSNIKKQLNPWL